MSWPSNGPEYRTPRRLEERGRLQHLPQRRLDALQARVGESGRRPAGRGAGARAASLADTYCGLQAQPADRLAELRHRRRVRPAVVVEDDHDLLAAVAEVVEALEGHAAGHRAVADDGDDLAVHPGALDAGGHAVGVGEDRRGVAVLDPVVLGLGAARVARHPAGLAQLGEAFAATGDDLVDVGLVPGVPQDDVAGRVEDAVDGERELDRPEVRAEVAAGHGDGLDDEGPDLRGQRLELHVVELPEVGRAGDVLEHGCLRG